jgi:flagellar assembly protein FliH
MTVPLPDAITFLRAPLAIALAVEKPASVFSEAQIEDARRAAYQRGFEDASRMLEKQLLEQRGEVLHLQQETFRSLARQHDSLVSQFRAALPELAMEVARRALAGAEIDRGAIARIVGEALGEIPAGSDVVEVALSPGDLASIEGNDSEFRERHPELRFRVDASLRAGDCVVRSRFGVLDARMETKLKNIGAAVQ